MKNHGILKSHVQEKLLDLVVETLVDAYALLRECDPTIIRKDDFTRDAAYLHMRVTSEGLPFLTETLPRLGEFLDKYTWGEDIGERVAGFKPYDGLFPCFLRPFWLFIGANLHVPEVSEQHVKVYKVLRTLLHGLKKLDIPCSQEKVDLALNRFLKIEEELETFEVIPQPWLWYSQRVLDQLFNYYVVNCRRPKHGPGAVAGGERLNQKWNFSTLYESVHAEFPYWEYFYPVRSAIGDLSGRSRALQLAENAAAYRNLRREKSPTARLLLVPKDSRGPRVISCEPKELMYLQQGVAQDLMDFIESHNFTSGHVNFERQDINGRLALESSYSHSMATLDLSDASDRVSVELVRYLFPHHVVKKWLALRSTATSLPDGRTIPLCKFAPMGSALCFPVESLCFWAIAVGTIWYSTGDLQRALSAVYVYGDDIIVDDKFAADLMKNLEYAGLKVNVGKSFMGDHPFRESCGVDAFKGFDVTICRVKMTPPRRSQDGTAVTAWVKYAENTQKLMPNRSRYCLRQVEALLGPIPRVPFAQSFLSIVTDDDHWSLENYNSPKWCVAASYWKAKTWTTKSRSVISAIPGWSRLQRNLIQGAKQGDPSRVVDRASTQINRKYNYITYLGAPREV